MLSKKEFNFTSQTLWVDAACEARYLFDSPDEVAHGTIGVLRSHTSTVTFRIFKGKNEALILFARRTAIHNLVENDVDNHETRLWQSRPRNFPT
jgi:hypothetical protein